MRHQTLNLWGRSCLKRYYFFAAAFILIATSVTASTGERDGRLLKTTNSEMARPGDESLNCHLVKIIDESVSPRAQIHRLEGVNDKYFRNFISLVTSHILSKLNVSVPCTMHPSDASFIELIFVRLPLATSGNEAISPAPSLNDSQSKKACRLNSPWARLTIQRSPHILIRSVFIWNERQFLLDQAVIAGMQGVPTTSPEPLARSNFERFAQDFASSVIVGIKPERIETLEDRIPADVLWLFRHAPPSTRGPFSSAVRSTMNTVLMQGSESYTKLVFALIDRCFASDGKNLQYTSVFDLADVIRFDEYRIDQLP